MTQLTSNSIDNQLGNSPNGLQQRKQEILETLAQVAPEIMSDKQLNLEKLKELLGEEKIAQAEHYELSWAGKSDARREIQKSTTHTLVPAENNPKQAAHMFIEGENLEVLRVLQKSYYGKVKMIYIDPPYNTGNDSFVYPDDYSETLDEYQKRTGEKSQEGFLNKQSLWKKNSKESGQYHSAWLSMMYPRLYLARNLLREDGVIFISIDDNEAANLKILCDEIFGAENFTANIIWNHTKQSKNDEKFFSRHHNQILCWVKNISLNAGFKFERTDEDNRNYSNPDNDPRGKWRSGDVRSPSLRNSLKFNIKTPSGKIIFPPENGWRWSEDTLLEKIKNKEIKFSDDETKIIRKIYLEEQIGRTPENLWLSEFAGTTRDATNELKELFDVAPFDTPKPTSLLKRLIKLNNANDAETIVLDFFAGSGTTSQAVMELNLEDGGSRQCICVQMPEVLEATSDAYKAGYKTISDITKARIQKVIEKLKQEQPDKTQDLACSNFMLAPSNFKVWQSNLFNTETLREQLAMFQTAEQTTNKFASTKNTNAMLTELLLKYGLGALGVHAISTPKQIANVTVYRVLLNNDSYLWLCFETYTAALKDEIIKAKPAQVILLNSCFVGEKADELLSNLQLELAGLDIALTII